MMYYRRGEIGYGAISKTKREKKTMLKPLIHYLKIGKMKMRMRMYDSILNLYIPSTQPNVYSHPLILPPTIPFPVRADLRGGGVGAGASSPSMSSLSSLS